MSRSPRRHANYFLKKGMYQRPDDPTDAYSDDEGAEDPTPVRRETKEAMLAINARANTLRERASRTKELGTQLPGTRLLADRNEQNHTLGLIPFENSSNFSQSVIDAGREIDRQTETTVFQRSETVRTPQGLDKRIQQNYMAFDIEKLLEIWQWARGYSRTLVVGGFVGIVGAYLLVNSLIQLFTYSTTSSHSHS